MKVAVHNFASASNPGGGVVHGANAQEECLCRCSDLYFCLNTQSMWDGFYNPHRDAHDPIHNDKNLLSLYEKRIRRILDVAVDNGDEAIVLGAFGCGAFSNNPEIVAAAAKIVIKDYMHAFKVIEYAVYCNPKNDRNLKIFESVLRQYCN